MTHFLDSGAPLLVLAATKTGTAVTTTLPTDPKLAVAGHYILFVGRIVRIAP